MSASLTPARKIPPGPPLSKGGGIIRTAGETPAPPALPPKALEIALKRADLVRLYRRAVEAAGRGAGQAAKKEFVGAYNLGAWPQLYAALGAATWQTLDRWAAVLRDTGDPLELAPRWGEKRRERRRVIELPGGLKHHHNHDVSEVEAGYLLGQALNPNAKPIAEAVRRARVAMQTDGVRMGRSEATHRRFLEDFRDRHYGVWVGCRRGEKAVNDEVAPYIVRDMDQMAVGDAAVADGHTFNFEILNPWTGKPQRMTLILFYDMFSKMPLGWEIMPTENTQAIAVAMRRAIIMLGKIPLCAYLDNGKAFRSKFFQGTDDLRQSGIDGLFGRLGMDRIYAWKYHGESKVVERFFGVLGEFERMMPTYVGNCIGNKPARMKMNEKWHRRLHQKITGGQAPDLIQIHQALAAFFEEYALREQEHGHLKGLRPWDVFAAGQGPGVDPGKLHELMMTVEIKRPGRNGVRLPGMGDYYHPALTGRRHPVLVRYDTLSPDFILVYEVGGEFICQAEPWGKVHPLASVTGTEADLEALSAKIAVKRSAIKTSMASVRAICNDLVVPETRRQLESQGLTPPQSPLAKGGSKKIVPVGPREIERVQQEFDRGGAEVVFLPGTGAVAAEDSPASSEAEDLSWRELDRMPELDRYEKLLELEAQGLELPARFQTFMSFFEKGPGYALNREWLEDRRLRLAEYYQVEGEFHGAQ